MHLPRDHSHEHSTGMMATPLLHPEPTAESARGSRAGLGCSTGGNGGAEQLSTESGPGCTEHWVRDLRVEPGDSRGVFSVGMLRTTSVSDMHLGDRRDKEWE